MLKHLLSLCLSCLLLCGCAAATPAEPAPAPPEQTAPPHSPVLYDAGSVVEQRTRGAVRAYPLTLQHNAGILAFGEWLVLFSGQDTTTLTLISEQEPAMGKSVTLDFRLEKTDPSLQVGDGVLSFFDPVRRETWLLDKNLDTVLTVPAPEGLLGTPILFPDASTLFYCTATALNALDLESGIHRCVREMSLPNPSVAGLYRGGSIVACRYSDGTDDGRLYISPKNGRLLGESKPIPLTTCADRYYTQFPTGMTRALLFGVGEEPPRALIPSELTAECFFLEEAHAAVTVSSASGGQMRLEYYDLASGLRRSVLALDGPCEIMDAVWANGNVYILAQDIIYRWDTEKFPIIDSTVYISPYYTAQAPDREGLSRCREKADRLEDAYGIEILIWEEAAGAVSSWPEAEEEYLVPVTHWALTELENLLSRFPEDMVRSTISHFDGITLCLFRQEAAPEGGCCLQHIEDGRAWLLLPADAQFPRNFLHGLFHCMETHIWSNSIALDQWEKLNPQGFSYDLDYQKNLLRNGDVYLRPETRAFIDTFSMSFPREDRARILEFACAEGAEALFRSEPMQAKLRALCEGIREAYGLRSSPEEFLWEQYLLVPLT